MPRGRNGAAVKQLRTLFHLGTTRELTDGQLLERFAIGGGETAEQAFAALVERHGPMVMRVCRSILMDAHDAQDAFQATFLVLVKKARKLWVRDSIGPWLHQVAYRTALYARQAVAHRRRHEQRAAHLRTEILVERHDDLARVLHEEIERLPERFRSPVILCDIEGRSHEQAARNLGWPVGTVKSRQARGRERLRDQLRRRGLAPERGVFIAALLPEGLSAQISSSLVESTVQASLQLVASRVFAPGSAASLAQGVLSSMNFARWLKVASVLLILGATGSGAGLLAQKSTQATPLALGPNLQTVRTDDAVTMSVQPGKLIVTVDGPGSVEASRFDDLFCLVEGQTTILRIKPDGSAVKKGEVVCELDSTSLRDRLVNQKITVKAAEANFENAKLTRKIAELAVTEYVDGIFKHELGAVKDSIAAAQSTIQKADARLERTRLAQKRMQDMLATKGAARSASDIVAELDVEDRLDSAALTLLRERQALEQAKSRKDLLEKITFPRTMRELNDDGERKYSAVLAKKAAWELEMTKLKKLERQITQCTIKAPRDGVVVYANAPRSLPGQHQIEEGATVRERQKILSVLDRDGPMQLNVKVAESHVDQIHAKMSARIRVDAFADEVLKGTVLEVAPLPDAIAFRESNKKVYTTKVRIDQRLAGLRPGMTARAEILVSELDNVLSVPVEAVVRYNDKYHVAVKKSDGRFEWREVVLGQSNDRYTEVKEGIKSGELVAVKALPLLSEEQKGTMKSSGNPRP